MRKMFLFLAFFLSGFLPQGSLQAAYVLPNLGGGNVPEAVAPMKHIVVSQSGTAINIAVDDSVETPLLRELEEPDEFDPAAAWAVLQDKAHNFQYGWLANGVWSLPPGSGVFVEELFATPELETYHVDGLIVSNTYDPIFGTDGSSSIWQWGGAMTHNAYAVLNPTLETYEATYRVYFGDAATGIPTPGYQSAEVTITLGATPVLTADFNEDGYVDATDLNTWETNYGMASGVTHSMGDADSNGMIDGLDFLLWQAQYTGGAAPAISDIPEPAMLWFLLGGIAHAAWLRPRKK